MERSQHSRRQPFFLILGTPNAGKTTLLYRLYSGIFYDAVQVSNRDIEEVRVDRIRLRILNILERKLPREFWEPLITESSGVIFVVNISSQTDIVEASQLFQEIRLSPAMIKIPLVIFGNKIDLPHNVSTLELLQSMKLAAEDQNKAFTIKFCSCKTAQGIIEGIEWLMQKANVYFYIPTFRK